jgi:hypothetical protein
MYLSDVCVSMYMRAYIHTYIFMAYAALMAVDVHVPV